MGEVTLEQLEDAMYELVKSTHGKKNLKPMDVTKAMIEKFGEDEVDKKTCKLAIRQLTDLPVGLVFHLLPDSFIKIRQMAKTEILS